MREAAHVARALDIVLAAQRVHPDALAPDIARRHREVGDRHHCRAALTMFGNAEAIVDRGIPARRVKPCRRANLFRHHTGEGFCRFRRAVSFGNKVGPVEEFVPIAALANEALVKKAFGDDDMRHRSKKGDISAGAQRQMMLGFDVRRFYEIGAPRIDDDELGALSQALLHAASEDGMAIGRIGTNHQHHVRLHHAVEILRSRRGSECRLQSVSGR